MNSEELDDLVEHEKIHDVENDIEIFSSQDSPNQDSSSLMNFSWNYDDLLGKLKNDLSTCVQSDGIGIAVGKFEELTDCLSLFLSQSFSNIASSVTRTPQSTCAYLENTSSVVQLFTKYLQQTADHCDMYCELLHTLPTKVACILKDVFIHCRESESLYGTMLSQVEGPLKELFKCCHELQSVYLQIMQKLVFNLQNTKELQTMVDALKTNVDIGTIVISLDVKTMAAQWKAFTAICEKYAELLAKESVAQYCVDKLCVVLMGNIKTLSEEELEEKAVQRCLKVSSFLMKIVIKMCQLFGEQVCSEYSAVVRLLSAIEGLDVSLRTSGRASLTQPTRALLGATVDPTVTQLLHNRAFASCLLSVTDSVSEDDVCGTVLLLNAVMLALLRRDDDDIIDLWLHSGSSILCLLLQLMPMCEPWLNYGLTFELSVKNDEAATSCGLSEYLLVSTAALSVRSSADHHAVLEEALVSTLLSTRSERTAIFVSDLLVIMARFSSVELCVDQLSSLIDIYKRMKESEKRTRTPYSVRLSATIQRLYKTLPREDRLKIYRQYPIDNVDNVVVWTALGINNLPELECDNISKTVFGSLKIEMRRMMDGLLKGNDVYRMIDKLRLACTCTPHSAPHKELTEMWLKCYPNTRMSALLSKEETTRPRVQWFLDLVLALIELTRSLVLHGAVDNKQLMQTLSVLTSLADKSACCVKLGAVKLLKSLSYYKIQDDLYTSSLCESVGTLFRALLKDADDVVKARARTAFKYVAVRVNNEEVILKTVNQDLALRDDLINFLSNDEVLEYGAEELRMLSRVEFVHKCDASDPVVGTDNFEMADIDGLFEDNEFDEAPKKKLKVDCDEVDRVLNRIESDVGQLETRKTFISEEQHARVKDLILRLQNNVLSI